MEAEPDLDEEDKQTLRAVRARRAELITEHRRKKSAGNNAPTLPRTVSASHADPKKSATAKRMKDSLEAMGLDPSNETEPRSAYKFEEHRALYDPHLT